MSGGIVRHSCGSRNLPGGRGGEKKSSNEKVRGEAAMTASPLFIIVDK